MENQSFPFVVIGLGNPGREYRETRHNIGFMVIDRLCRAMGISLTRVQSKALTGVGVLEGKKVVVGKPQTFMNLSGQSVSGLIRFYKTPLDQLIVAHDDLDLPLGTIRLRPGGGSAGQKGMVSIIQQLGSQDFARLRVGIGRPPGRMDPSAFVLQKFTAGEMDLVDRVLDRALAAVRIFVTEGLDAAMNQHNGALAEK